MNSRRCPLAAWLLIAACLCLCQGCGRKTLPVPPQTLIPVPVTTLACTENEGSGILTWTAPQRTTTGERLHSVDTYEILRGRVSAAEYCPECPVVFSLIAQIPGGNVQVNGRPATVQFRDTDLDQGNFYVYKMRSRSGLFIQSSDSNRVTLHWQTPRSETNK